LLSKERCQRPTRKDKLDLACFLGDAITSGWCNEASFYTSNHPTTALMSPCRNHYSISTYKPTSYRHYFHAQRSGFHVIKQSCHQRTKAKTLIYEMLKMKERQSTKRWWLKKRKNCCNNSIGMGF
jgi:hypothetical protein